jgi:hypothetical protein
MPRRKKEQHDDREANTKELDSPTILSLIEQLDDDLVETNLNGSKTQLRAQAL